MGAKDTSTAIVRFRPGEETLSNSQPFIWTIRVSEAVQRLGIDLASEIFKDARIYKKAPNRPRRVRDCCALLVANLVRVAASDPTRYVGISLSAAAYTGKPFDVSVLRRVLRALELRGYVEPPIKGRQGGAKGRGVQTRVRSTQALQRHAVSYGIDALELTPPPTPLVRLRSAAKTGKRWPVDPGCADARRRMTAELETINAALAATFIGLPIPDTELANINVRLGALYRRDPGYRCAPIDFGKNALYRVFNETPQQGGRMFGGWWQSIPRELRKLIRVGYAASTGLRTETRHVVEADYSSLQPAMLYSRVGMDLPGRAYQLPHSWASSEENQAVVKTALLVMLNARGRDKARAAVQRALQRDYVRARVLSGEVMLSGGTFPALSECLPPGCPPITDVLSAIEESHEPIEQFFYTGVSRELMHAESEMAVEVMLRMIDRGVVPLPIHDSFIVHKAFALELELEMERAAEKVVGRPLKLKTERPALSGVKDRTGLVLKGRAGLASALVDAKRESETLTGASIYRQRRELWLAEQKADRYAA